MPRIAREARPGRLWSSVAARPLWLDTARPRSFALRDMNPWLTVSASDYEGHMIAAGQLGALSAIFRDVYLEQRPRRLAVLGCATGKGFEHIESSVTEHVIGVGSTRPI